MLLLSTEEFVHFMNTTGLGKAESPEAEGRHTAAKYKKNDNYATWLQP